MMLAGPHELMIDLRYLEVARVRSVGTSLKQTLRELRPNIILGTTLLRWISRAIERALGGPGSMGYTVVAMTET
jgi:hypothetical protein